MKIRSLRTNHLTNPLGYAIDRPVLTWTAESATGKKQQSACVQISLNDAFEPCLYDSGLHLSGQLEEPGVLTRCAARDDGSVLLISSQGSALYLP